MIQFEKLPENILSRLPDAQKILSGDRQVVFAYLFGGLAEGTVRPLSDIDIAVYLRDTAHLAEYKLLLFERLADAMGTGEIDLVILNTAPISLVGRVLLKKRLLVDKNPFQRHSFESTALRKFFDFRIKEDLLFERRYGIGR
jgi:hypothetical protein